MNIMLRNALRKNIGLRHQLEKNLLGEDGELWEGELKKFLRKETCWEPLQKKTKAAPRLLKSVASGVGIAEASAVKIADCFKVGNGVYDYRDSDFDGWLPKEIRAVGAGIASTFELVEPLTLKEMAEAHLGITGSHDELKKALIEQGKCWSPKQIDDLLRNCERGKNPLKLRTDKWVNLFFMQVGNDVFAVCAHWGPSGWYVSISEFASADRWDAENRVSLRN